LAHFGVVKMTVSKSASAEEVFQRLVFRQDCGRMAVEKRVEMEFIQLNQGWNAEPNAPNPQITVEGSDIKLSFSMNPFIFKDFDEDDIGVIRFKNCYQYRMGSPNEDDFYVYGKSRYKQYGVKWGEFYRVKNSDWQTNFPDSKTLNIFLDKDSLNHYLFYFRDETFECIAESYSFMVLKGK
jgi:hypothetical protein